VLNKQQLLLAAATTSAWTRSCSVQASR
jgi:hypothetical protein